MKNKITRKGFTIVELVIVIAVIAILAAVLIPTFSSIIRKSKVSSDTQVCRNMNTAIAVGIADGSSMDSFYDVLTALKNAGYIMSNLNPTAEGNYYGWDKENNKIIYMDENLNVIYPEGHTYEAASLYIPVSTYDAKTLLLAKNASVNAVFAPKSETVLVDVVKKINDGTITGEQQIVLADDIILTTNTNTSGGSANSLTVNKDDAVLNLVLGTQTISVLESTSVAFNSDRVLQVNKGTMNIQGGKIVTDEHSYGAIKCVDGTLTVTDTEMQSCKGYGLSVKVVGGEATLNNVTISSIKGGCACVDNDNIPASLTINGGSYVQKTYDSEPNHGFCSCTVASSGGGTVTINGGTFICEQGDAVVRTFSSPGKIVINDGKFTAIGERTDENGIKKNVAGSTETFVIYVDVCEDQYYTQYNCTHDVVIHGGTFEGKIYIASCNHPGVIRIDGGTFNGVDYKSVNWDDILVGTGYTVTTEGNTVTITK